MISIRPLSTHADYHAAEQLQREVWGMAEVEIVPNHVMLTAQRHAGIALGAFDDGGPHGPVLVGFVFGFLGRAPDGALEHVSHIAGVAPGYRDQGVGYRLKLAQREQALAQGLKRMVWTFDPLECRNAYFNFHKLGAVCRTYRRDVYGEMQDALNAGLPSDRFEVEWRLDSPHVLRALTGRRAALDPARLPQVAGPAAAGDAPAWPAASRVLIEIPADFQALKAANLALARAWRLHTRALFEAAFDSGYLAVDVVADGEQRFMLMEAAGDWKRPGGTTDGHR
jgi:predicted GNAT superfamily acetyltransferase